jgi:hypothetical protein
MSRFDMPVEHIPLDIAPIAPIASDDDYYRIFWPINNRPEYAIMMAEYSCITNHSTWVRTNDLLATRGAHLPLLQWARASGCPWDARTCAFATQGGHLPTPRWKDACELVSPHFRSSTNNRWLPYDGGIHLHKWKYAENCPCYDSAYGVRNYDATNSSSYSGSARPAARGMRSSAPRRRSSQTAARVMRTARRG